MSSSKRMRSGSTASSTAFACSCTWANVSFFIFAWCSVVWDAHSENVVISFVHDWCKHIRFKCKFWILCCAATEAHAAIALVSVPNAWRLSKRNTESSIRFRILVCSSKTEKVRRISVIRLPLNIADSTRISLLKFWALAYHMWKKKTSSRTSCTSIRDFSRWVRRRWIRSCLETATQISKICLIFLILW